MNRYLIKDQYDKTYQRRGTMIKSDSGLYYFLADYNKAKRFDSIPRYRFGGGLLELYRFTDVRTKKYIDDACTLEGIIIIIGHA